MPNNLITIAIHTAERAYELKSYLDSENVETILMDFETDDSNILAIKKVMVKDADIIKALRLIENAEIFTANTISLSSNTNKKIILVPVDFTMKSQNACYLAFSLAHLHNSEVVLIHSFLDASFTDSIHMPDNLDFDISEAEIRETMIKDAEKKMSELSETLRNKIKNSELPPVKFSREIIEGIPEEVINEYAKKVSPFMIIMGTRGVEKRERELIGSITAEVLDTCRYPIFTLPEETKLLAVNQIKQVSLFCTLEKDDMEAIDYLARLNLNEKLKINLIILPDKKRRDLHNELQALIEYMKNFPEFSFTVKNFSLEHAVEEFHELLTIEDNDLLVVPNKKKNVFTRLFNPGLAHKLLYKTDAPMIVLPV